MCFRLGIPTENLTGNQPKNVVVIALIEHCERHDRQDDLVVCCKKLRPKRKWNHFLPDGILSINTHDLTNKSKDGVKASLGEPNISSETLWSYTGKKFIIDDVHTCSQLMISFRNDLSYHLSFN